MTPVELSALAAAALKQSQEPPPTQPPVVSTQQAALRKPTLEPQGFPGLPEKDERLPEPQGESPRTVRILSGEQISREGDILKIRGNVHIQYRGYDIFGREVDGDFTTNIFTVRGGAQLIGKDAVVLAETITVDYDKRTYRALKSSSEVRPGFLQGRTLDNVYLYGEESWGSERELFAHDCGLTTCVYDKPHYLLDASKITLRPNKRIILRNVHFELLGKRLLTIPYLSIPLDTRREGYTPEVGHTPQEGYYVKTKWAIPVKGSNWLDANVDYFEKLGAGLGGRYAYANHDNEGYLRAYALTGDTKTVEIQQGHRFLFGNNLFQIENNYQQRNFVNAPENTIFTTRATLTLPQRNRNMTRLTWYRMNNESPTFESTSQTLSVTDSRSLWEAFRTQTDVSWVQSESKFSSGGSSREQVDIRFRGTQEFRSAFADLDYQRSIPVGETSNFFSASDRTPVLTVRTDSNKLFGNRNTWLPFKTELSIGEFVNPSDKERVNRSNFDFQFDKNDGSNRRLNISYNGRFKQSFYSDDTAQYALGYGAMARYAFAPNSTLNLRHNYLEREGFTPLAIDRIGKTNLTTLDASYQVTRSLSLGAQTGYDHLLIERRERTAWQPVGLRAEFKPAQWFSLRALPIYDPFRQAWSSVRMDLTYIPGATYVAVGARYDGIRQVWGAVNLFVDGLKYGRLKTSALFNYNGYLRKFEDKQYSFTYDLHCAEAILQIRENNIGFRTGREIYFFIRLKAFPFDTPFGNSRRGAPLGTATGR